ncbi:MAG: AraC family transcriptional regulator [Marinobacterium sp.]|nr:AraC family transcriptional regulator [Marinobacterium sp.]
MTNIQQFYRSTELPWLEIRHSANTDSCFQPHSHRTHSIGCLLEGQSYFHYRNQKRATHAGHLCLINADELHACRPTTDAGWRYLMLYLDKHWLGQMLNEGAEDCTDALSFEHALLEHPSLTTRFIKQCFALTCETGLTQQEQLLTLLLEIGLYDSGLSTERHPDCSPAIHQIAEYIRAHYDQNITLTELAQLCQLSPSHLQRSFRKYYGISPSHFQHQCRIHAACDLLKQQHTIGDVATATGYADQSHLYRWFRRFVDSTPRQYSQIQMPTQIQTPI